jgi:hypothetical protein
MIKINSLELENVKRVKALTLQPSANGLTVIGGDNAQGKTSVLDAICYALGGEKYRPTNLQREGGISPASISVTLSNGLIVTRSGKNAALKVIDPSGVKGGQRLLDSFVDELAINLPKFLAMGGKDKAAVLLRILGIGDKLESLDKEERAIYQEREAFGRIADQKAKYFQEMPWFADVPEEPISAGDLVRESQEVMARNAERQNARRNVEKTVEVANKIAFTLGAKRTRLDEMLRAVEEAKKEIERIEIEHALAADSVAIANSTIIAEDESTAEIQQRIESMEEINRKVRANLDKAKARADSDDCKAKYGQLTAKVDEVRARRKALLDGAAMPLPGLSVEAGELTYQGKAWDCMSSMERIRSAVAIVRKLKPECGFVLLDGLESFDLQQLDALGGWLSQEGLQAIATRVSRGEECSIIIEDGLAIEPAIEQKTAQEAEW